MTTVLLVGEMTVGQTAYFCSRALSALGVRVINLDAGGYPTTRWRVSVWPGLPVISHWLQKLWINVRLLPLARALQPDGIFILGGRDIRASVLKRVKRLGSGKLLNWNTDNPLNKVNSSADLLAAIPLYDCHFTWGRFLIPELTRLGARQVEYLPFCYDPALHRPVAVSGQERARLGHDLTFVGTWEPAREHLLDHLTEFDLGLWGNHWHRLAPGSPLRSCVRGVAEGDRQARVLSACKITLNFVRAQNGSAHNLRTFEAPACGAFMLSTRTEEQVELLGENVGAAFFDSPDEMHDKIDFFLDHPEERTAISHKGYEIVTKGNTYQDRMARVLVVISESDAK